MIFVLMSEYCYCYRYNFPPFIELSCNVDLDIMSRLSVNNIIFIRYRTPIYIGITKYMCTKINSKNAWKSIKTKHWHNL